jgi:zinc-binding in reverse transcriptase
VVQSACKVLNFKRTLTGVLLLEFNEICAMTQRISLSTESANYFGVWRYSNTGSFSTHNVYEWLMYRGMTSPSADIWWVLPIPLKVKVFMWLVCHNRILTKDNLHKRGWDGNLQFIFCSENETVSHLFVTCGWVTQIWFWMDKCQNYLHCWSN